MHFSSVPKLSKSSSAAPPPKRSESRAEAPSSSSRRRRTPEEQERFTATLQQRRDRGNADSIGKIYVGMPFERDALIQTGAAVLLELKEKPLSKSISWKSEVPKSKIIVSALSLPSNILSKLLNFSL